MLHALFNFHLCIAIVVFKSHTNSLRRHSCSVMVDCDHCYGDFFVPKNLNFLLVNTHLEFQNPDGNFVVITCDNNHVVDPLWPLFSATVNST